MSDQRQRLRRRAWAALMLTLALCASAVGAAIGSHWRWDWTAEKIYTLSDSTRSVLHQLDAPLMIRAYVTSGLPQPYGRMGRFIEDMLRAYHEEGGGNVGYAVMDPTGDADAMATLTALNVPKVRVQVVENDQAQVKQGYLAVVLEYLDRKEVLPVVQGEEGFEYLLTSKIRKLTGKDRPTIGIVSGFGADDYYRLQRLRRLAGEDYAFVAVDPAKEKIPDSVDALIVAGLEEKPSELFRYRLDQFRMHGHGVLVLAGNAKADLAQEIGVRSLKAEANAWLAKDLGVSVEPGLILDRQSARILVNQPQGVFMLQAAVDYPFLLRVTNVDAQHPVTRGLESVNVPFASPLAVVGNVQPVALLRSSGESAVQDGPPFDVDPLVPVRRRFANISYRPSIAALAYEGPARSSFKTSPKGAEDERHQESSELTRWIVVGSPSMLEDELLDNGELLFVLNALDWLSGQDEMIALRSRGASDRPLPLLSDSERRVWKAIWMFAVPGLVAIGGLLRWRWLRRRRAA